MPRLLLASAALLTAGCAAGMALANRSLSLYEAGLQLEVAFDGPPQVGGRARVTLRLSNVTRDQTIRGCTGEAWSHLFVALPPRDGRAPAGGMARTIDHPGCVLRFSLAPGDAMSWSEEWDIPDIGAGPAKVFLSVQVLEPRVCEEYGCYATMVKAQPFEVELAGREYEQPGTSLTKRPGT